jgi:UMF1 family MFS transporter
MTTSEISSDKFNWKGVIGYALYDWACSPVPTLHATFIFAVYFTTQVAPENGTSYWGYMTALASLSVAIIAPIIGGIADARSIRKIMLFIFTLIGGLSTMFLWNIIPENSYMMQALIISFISIFAMELTFVFYNSLLPSVAKPNQMGFVSGISWGFGYFGAILCLLLALFIFIQAKEPPFGLTWDNSGPVRATMILAAVWLFIFSIPSFIFISEKKTNIQKINTYERLINGFNIIIGIPGLLRFMIARMLYTDGLTVVFAFAGIYAAKVFEFPQDKVIMFAVAVNIFCGIGAIAGGFVEDKIGAFKTVRLSLFFLLLLGTGILLAPTEIWFWIFALLVGIFIGPVQSSSRSLVARCAPNEHRAQIFGFYMFAGKSTSFIGPAIYGWLVMVTGIERAGMLVVLVFFIAGIIVLGSKGPRLTMQN